MSFLFKLYILLSFVLVSKQVSLSILEKKNLLCAHLLGTLYHFNIDCSQSCWIVKAWSNSNSKLIRSIWHVFLFLCVYLYPRILLCTLWSMYSFSTFHIIDYLLNLNVHTSRTVNNVVFLHMLSWQQYNMCFQPSQPRIWCGSMRALVAQSV